MPTEKVGDQFYAQISESIKLVFDLTSRVDERVKMLMEKQSEIDDKFSKLMNELSNLSSRLLVLESKDFGALKNDMEEAKRRLAIIESKPSESFKDDIEKIESKVRKMELKHESLAVFKSGTEDRWKTVVEVIWKILVAVAVAYILYKTGISSTTTIIK